MKQVTLVLLVAFMALAIPPPAMADGPPTDEFDCVVTAIWFEARGESQLGQRWVFEVIRNRADLRYRGQDTYCDVIYDRKQFSYANRDNSIRPQPRNSEQQVLLNTIRARVFDWMFTSPPFDISCGATHYLRYDIAWKVRWSREALTNTSGENLVPLAIIGDHWFFGPKQTCYWR